MTRYTKKYTFSIKTDNGNFASQEISYLPLSKRNKSELLGEDAINNDAVNKLSALEDIEEELGIDLITLYKAFKNGIWRKMFGGGIIHYESNQISVYIDHIDTESGKELYLFDYGKEWALTKEELE